MSSNSGVSEMMPTYFHMKNISIIPNKNKEATKKVYPDKTYACSEEMPDYLESYIKSNRHSLSIDESQLRPTVP